MNKNTSVFKLVVMGVFGLFLLVGVVTFSTFKPSSDGDNVGDVLIWGTYNQEKFEQYLDATKDLYSDLKNVTYREFSKTNFNQEVLEALASGQSPDLLFIDDSQLYPYLNKIYTLTPESYSKRDFQDQFVELGELYFQNDGIVALPLAADPLVMFWNRDIFSSEGLARPPSSWTEFFELSQTLTQVDESLNIKRSAIAFGETRNVNFFREIMATLLFQIGNPIVGLDSRGVLEGKLEGDDNIESAFPALRFYTEFSDASKSVYSWNRSLPDSEEAFLSGKLAVYFAPSSQIDVLRKKNPNLNFAISEIPRVDEEISSKRSVQASLYGFMIPRASDNVGGAFQTAVMMTNADSMQIFTNLTNLAPVRRDLIDTPSQEVYQDVLKKEALYAQTFLDPNYEATGELLSNMVEYITSGQRSIDDAIYVSQAQLDDLLSR